MALNSGSLDAARAYYADVKGRMAKYGREPDDLKIMPALCPVVGRTRAEAQAKYDALQALIDPLAGLGALYSSFGDRQVSALDAAKDVHDPVIGSGDRDLATHFNGQCLIRALALAMCSYGEGVKRDVVVAVVILDIRQQQTSDSC